MNIPNAIHVIGVSNLVKKTDYDKKLEETEKKLPRDNRYITTNNFNKFQPQYLMENWNKKISN